ncbi:MAG: DUF839 domain-containing protein, partial [Bryobacterales bacterium]|nr:DUF839 domain-containing protein [Bryobacterales bacterium]
SGLPIYKEHEGFWRKHYLGDDARFEYVSDGTNEESDRKAAMRLLDSRTLYVAKFNADGSGEWLPLTHENGALNATSGFEGQADVLLFARQAADLLGGTQMDRPEDIEANPVTGSVYVALTNNTRRQVGDETAANPGAPNPIGHIVEITEAGGDNGARSFSWEIFMLCGDLADPSQGAFFLRRVRHIHGQQDCQSGQPVLRQAGQPADRDEWPAPHDWNQRRDFLRACRRCGERFNQADLQRGGRGRVCLRHHEPATGFEFDAGLDPAPG